MTLQQAMDEVAISKGYPDWKTMEDWYIDKNYVQNAAALCVSAMREATTLYATEKIKEALQLAAKKVDYRENFCGQHAATIISLADELIEKINKEI